MAYLSRNLFKACLYILIAQFVIWFALSDQSLLRSLNTVRTESGKKQVPTTNCTYHDANVCECPYSCFEPDENNKHCVIKKCYEIEQSSIVNGEPILSCKQIGKDHVAPLVLQAIPFTGIFGSGFGNIGRWDLFGVFMAILFGGCCALLIPAAICSCCLTTNDDNLNELKLVSCWVNCGGCLWIISILAFYILGIVWTATPGAILEYETDPRGCPLIF